MTFVLDYYIEQQQMLHKSTTALQHSLLKYRTQIFVLIYLELFYNLAKLKFNRFQIHTINLFQKHLFAFHQFLIKHNNIFTGWM